MTRLNQAKPNFYLPNARPVGYRPVILQAYIYIHSASASTEETHMYTLTHTHTHARTHANTHTDLLPVFVNQLSDADHM